MLKKLMLATIASFIVMSGLTSAAPSEKQQFHVDISGAVEADLLTGNIKNTEKQKKVTFQACPMCTPFDLESYWQDQAYMHEIPGSDCFSVGEVQGQVTVSETKSGEAKAQFWFDSYTTGAAVRYLLILTAPGWKKLDGSTPEEFPPTAINGDSAYMFATHWEMETVGKGKLRKSACKGEGSFGLTAETSVLLIVQRRPLDL